MLGVCNCGDKKFQQVPDTIKETLHGIVHEHIWPVSTICADDAPSYNSVAYRYLNANYSAKEYVNGEATPTALSPCG